MLCDNKEDCQSGQQIIKVRKDFVRVADCSLLTKLRQQHMLNEKQDLDFIIEKIGQHTLR